MLMLISPAKSLNFEPQKTIKTSEPRMKPDTDLLVDVMKKQSVKKLMDLMSISEKLGNLNRQRYHDFATSDPSNVKSAVLAFNGDVYVGLDAASLGGRDLQWAQKRLRILSGLYGLLRPMDLIQPYRLEMGTRLITNRGKNLYEFWGDGITDMINTDLAAIKGKAILNLASKEYFKAVNVNALKAEVYDFNFFEKRNGVYKFISFTAKKARGWVARYVIENRITKPEGVKGFAFNGYGFNDEMSSDREFVFTKDVS